MHLLSADRVRAEIEGRTLFSDVSFGLTSNDRVAVVGPNGSGKTTLLRIIAGDRKADGGEIVTRSGLQIAMLAQDPDLGGGPALEVVVGTDGSTKEHEAAAWLQQLGIEPGHRTDAMSGGQRRRVALARTLLSPADLLILDEPTNHLDVETIDRLEQELQRRTCGLVLVTHDRYVLERLTNRMLDICPLGPDQPAEVLWHEGSYSSLLEARAQRADTRQRTTARARNLLRKEVAWLQRAPKARTSKPRFRVEQAEILKQAATGDAASSPLELGTGRRRLGNDVFELEKVTVVRGDTTVLAKVDLGIGPGERVGIVGPNGAGKTTLLHVLCGRLPADSGTVRIGQTVEMGIYEQQAGSGLNLDQTVLDSVLEIAPHIPLANGETLPAHRLAERFGFDGVLQRTPIGLLSGGERRRVALLHLLVAAPNVLLLDEPTNDLDLDTLAVLEDHLDGFEGTLIVASHDRYVLDRLTDRTIAVAHGQLSEHLDLDAYRRSSRSRTSQGSPGSDRRRETGPGAASDAPTTQSNQDRQAARKTLRTLERRVQQLDRRRRELHEAMVDAASDPDRLLPLEADLRTVESDLAQAEDDWLELSVATGTD